MADALKRANIKHHTIATTFLARPAEVDELEFEFDQR